MIKPCFCADPARPLINSEAKETDKKERKRDKIGVAKLAKSNVRFAHEGKPSVRSGRSPERAMMQGGADACSRGKGERSMTNENVTKDGEVDGHRV